MGIFGYWSHEIYTLSESACDHIIHGLWLLNIRLELNVKGVSVSKEAVESIRMSTCPKNKLWVATKYDSGL